MNWGQSLALFIAVFILVMVGIVLFSMQQTNEMIDENYYQKEEAYQNLIDAKKRLLKALSGRPFILDSMAYIVFKFPNNISEGNIFGKIECLKIDNQKLDTIIVIKSVENGLKIVPKANLNRGRYRFRVSWEHQGLAYYYDESLNIKK